MAARPKGVPQNKATQSQQLLRINEVIELLISYQKKNTIVRYLAEKHGIGERQSEKLIRDATDIIREYATFEREERIGKGVAFREKVIRETLSEKNYMQAQITHSDMDRLLGLYAPTKSEVAVADYRDMTREELLERKKELVAKLKSLE